MITDCSCSRTTGRSHSTPETETSTSKPFSSRTYHTIKDMISSRFSNGKSKMDQISETGLNNSESNGGNETPKTDNNLSPHSQLVQRGVYLANSQSCNRNTTYSRSGIDLITRRNQEVRDKIIGQYRERAVDVGQTAGVAQQAVSNTSTNVSAGVPNGRYVQESEPKSLAQTGRRCLLDCETPNRYRDQPPVKNVQRYEYPTENELRNLNRYEDGYDDSVRTNGTADVSGNFHP